MSSLGSVTSLSIVCADFPDLLVACGVLHRVLRVLVAGGV
jgi:hypothetical protein